MNIHMLRDLIERLSTGNIEKVNRAYVLVSPYAKKEESDRAAVMRRIEMVTYSLGGYQDEVTDEMLCRGIFKSVVADMPAGPSRLFWRMYPDREEDYQRKPRHMITLRLAWMEIE